MKCKKKYHWCPAAATTDASDVAPAVEPVAVVVDADVAVARGLAAAATAATKRHDVAPFSVVPLLFPAFIVEQDPSIARRSRLPEKRRRRRARGRR